MTAVSKGGLNYQPNLKGAMNEISDRLRNLSATEEPTGENDRFLLANIEATIGPRGVAPDMESLSGRSHRRLNRSHHHRHHRISTNTSVDSRTSRQSFPSYQSNQSAISYISTESQSVANDLFRLEAQLAMVAKQQQEQQSPPLMVSAAGSSNEAESLDNLPSSTSDLSIRSMGAASRIIGAEPLTRPTPVEIIAPPGKLGLLLANKSGQNGPTHVSTVRSESVLAGKVHVGDRFVSIDGEDVTRMNSKEITAIMARKSDFERVIVLIPYYSSGSRNKFI